MHKNSQPKNYLYTGSSAHNVMAKLSHFTITIRCKSYLKKYFTSFYGDPVELDDTDEFADNILTKLSNKGNYRVTGKNLNICNTALEKYSAKITFKIPFWFFYRINKNIPAALVYKINIYLQKVF